jgi:hypothetical protein
MMGGARANERPKHQRREPQPLFAKYAEKAAVTQQVLL